jgi:flagellar biosynthetic protein FlhB
LSECLQDRTEEATPKRRRDAAEKGEVPRSQELTTAALLAGSALVLNLTLPRVGHGLVELYGTLTLGSATAAQDASQLVPMLRSAGRGTLLLTMPLLASLAVVSATIAGVQARGTLTMTPLAPKWSRVSPVQNAKQLIGIRSLAEFVKSLLKLVVVGIALWYALTSAWSDIIVVGQQHPAALAAALLRYAVRLLLTAGLAYIAIAGADYAFQVWQHEKRLRMTKEEVKQEHKETEGDPMIRSRRRSLARTMLRRQMFADVANADVVVTNPTHIAVALKYDAGVAAAPIVLAMGQRKIAERIKRLAHEAGVPVIENKPLARALLKTARIGLPIPPELYVAVAEVLAFVIRRRAAGAVRWQGSELL